MTRPSPRLTNPTVVLARERRVASEAPSRLPDRVLRLTCGRVIRPFAQRAT